MWATFENADEGKTCWEKNRIKGDQVSGQINGDPLFQLWNTCL
jgi:hypothetical protein